MDAPPSTSQTIPANQLRQDIIKSHLIEGKYSISPIQSPRKNSQVWKVFGRVITDSGAELPDYVACNKCFSVFKHSSRTTSNLTRHKCYCQTIRKSTGSDQQKIEVDIEVKKKFLIIFIMWVVRNCRPFLISEDCGLKKIIEFVLSIGAKFGENVDVSNLMPHPTTISKNVEKLSSIWKDKVKEEISCIKDIAFTSDLWTDSHTHISYVSLTAHYILLGKMKSRALGMRTMQGEDHTGEIIKGKISRILSDFGIQLKLSTVFVTDRGPNMKTAFDRFNRLNCVNHLLNNVIEQSVKKVEAVDNMIKICSKLARYFKKSNLNAALQTTLKSYVPTRWNTVYYLLNSIERNWSQIIEKLQQKGEMHRVENINIVDLAKISKFLKKFEEISKQLEGSSYATIHRAFSSIHYLKKSCSVDENDGELLKKLKETFSSIIEAVVDPNLSIYHKIALLLFPPANSLTELAEIERNLIINTCKNLMEEYSHDSNEIEIANAEPTQAEERIDIFGAFCRRTNLNEDNISNEIQIYLNTVVKNDNDFDLLKWWEQNKSQLPLLYQLSQKILCIPASSAESERLFSKARNLISEKRSRLDPVKVDSIMFLNSNITDEDIDTELQHLLKDE